MRASQLLIPTLKETPADADIPSHRFMLRAGLIRRLAAGIYTWLPLGLRVLRKVEAIIREETRSQRRAGSADAVRAAGRAVAGIETLGTDGTGDAAPAGSPRSAISVSAPRTKK